MTVEAVRARLAAALRLDLPGAEAQLRMAPRPRRTWPSGFNQARVRHAAGLLLVVPVDDVAHVVLTVRSDRVRHGGQVSLPGGVVEPGETFEQTALREAREEVALAEPVEVLGGLTPLDIPVSGFRLYPVVGVCQARPALRPSDGEVAHILEVSVPSLLDNSRVRLARLSREGVAIEAPGFAVADHLIWGATAMVLAEWLTLLGWSGPPSR